MNRGGGRGGGRGGYDDRRYDDGGNAFLKFWLCRYSCHLLLLEAETGTLKSLPKRIVLLPTNLVFQLSLQ
jgi:hypothetical protein